MQDYFNERWVVVEEFPNYEVSDHGRVRSVGRLRVDTLGRSRFWSVVILKQRLTHDGYSNLMLYHLRNGKYGNGYTRTVHRLVAKAFVIGYSEINRQVNHLDGVKTNNHFTNLEWTTGKANTNHAIDIGLRNYIGESNPRCKLSAIAVLEIKSLMGKIPQRTLAKMYGVGKTQIARIFHGQTWKHLA